MGGEEKNQYGANAALFLHPDAVETRRERLMGRHVAGAGFLKGFVDHSGVDRFHAYAMNRPHFDDLVQRIAAHDSEGRPVQHIGPHRDDLLAGVGTLLFPGPGLADLAWRRRRKAGPMAGKGGQRAYSLCGMAFGLAQETGLDALGALMCAPMQPWDALVCPSNTAKGVIKRLFDNLGEYYDSRFGGYALCEAQLPVIPMGVDFEAYQPGPRSDGARALMRHRHDIDEGDIVLVHVGRLSFHAKSHPLALFQAAAEARRRTGKPIHILLAGWFASDGIADQYRLAARMACPDVPVHVLDGRDRELVRAVWAAGDIFVSLNDSLQSAQGSALLEAMASGLPSVASDWGALREILRHGQDGFLIPAWMPAGGHGDVLALDEGLGYGPHDRQQAYNRHAGEVSQTTAVDVAAAAEALTLLAGDGDLRRKMGEAARARARSRYDWRIVIAAYQVLWRELAAIRGEAKEVAPVLEGAPGNPVRDDPYVLFGDYPSDVLDRATIVGLRPGVTVKGLEAWAGLPMNEIAGTTLLDADDRRALVEALAISGPRSLDRLSGGFKGRPFDALVRTVAWMAKMGLVRLANAGAGDDLFGLPTGFAAGGADRPAWRATSGADTEGYWRERLAEDEWDVEALTALGRAARKEGRTDEVLRHFEKALEREPDDPDLNNAVGEIWAARGRMDEAQASFRRALRGAPGFGAAHRNLGRTLFLTGRVDAARATFERALTLAPEDAECWYLLGVLHRRAGRAEAAKAALEKALVRNPEHVDALCHLGLAEKALGRRAQALEAFYKADFQDAGNVFALSAEASLAVEPAGRARVEKGVGSARKVALHIAQKNQYGLFRPLFDAFAERHWPLLTVDPTDVAQFEPDSIVICDGQANRLRKEAPEAWIVFVWPSFDTSDALLGA
ncbi:MAG: tetratricopeptide repeat protein, partial [Rhodospirillales bacterium]